MCLSGECLCGKLSIQADKPVVSLGLECMKISPPSLSFFPLILFVFSLAVFLHTLSLSLPITLLSLPGLPPSARLPAAFKHTAHFCLAARRLACSLEPAVED